MKRFMPARPGNEDPEPLSRAVIRELKRRMRDHDDPIRYLLVSEFSRRFILYYDVSRDVYVMNDPGRGTLFKQLQIAQAVRKHLGRGVSIVKYTTKGGKLKRLSPHQDRFHKGRSRKRRRRK